MTHLERKVDGKPSSIRTPREWLMVGKTLMDFANTRAARHDIVICLADDAGHSAPACFVPTTAELEVNRGLCFDKGVKPSDVGDFNSSVVRREHPIAAGVMLHEISHARWTRFELKALNDHAKEVEKPELVPVVHWLEEGRIEALAVRMWPRDREFLRASALMLALADSEDEEPKLDDDGNPVEEKPMTGFMNLVKMACLVEARIVGDVVEYRDVAKVADMLETQIGEDRYSEMRTIFEDVHAINDTLDPQPLLDEMLKCAERMLALKTDEEQQQEDEQKADAQAAADAAKELGDMLGDMMDALGEAADTSEINARDALNDQASEERAAQQAAVAKARAEEREKNKKAATKVFSQSSGPATGQRTDSELAETRAPNSIERAAAIRLGKSLERINYRERTLTNTKRALPPGRLHARTAVQGSAQRAQGVMVTAEPWLATHRRHTDSAPLTAGVMVDISGSMSDAMEPMASAAWVLSEAVRRVAGTAAMVYYGESVFPTLKPHQHLDRVNVYTAPDGTEEFDLAIRALDGALNLRNGEGARILFVVSDGCYRNDMRPKTVKWVKDMHKAGVVIVWLSMNKAGGWWSSVLDDAAVNSRVTIINGCNTKETLNSIGAAVIDAFKKAN